MSVLPVALACCALGALPQPSKARLIAERGAGYSLKDGDLELRGGGGWLRFPRLYLDFRVAFDYKVAAPDTDAGAVVRVWPGRGGWPDRGYRVRLPTGPHQDVSAAFTGRRQGLTVIETGRIELRPPGEWQHRELTGTGRLITLHVNGTLVGAVEIEEFGGHVLLDARKGRVRLGNISIAAVDPISEWPESSMPVKDRQNPGLRPPKLEHEVRPNYTPETIAGLVHSQVKLEAVVLSDGSVGPVRIVRSLDSDLDVSAIAAVKRWKFVPGALRGNLVPVLVVVEVDFTLK